MRARLFALTILPIAAAMAAQDGLPAHVLLLQRIKLHMRDEILRQPDYTCLQTTARYARPPGREGALSRVDTVLLEVLTSGGKEFYGSPGEGRFSTDSPGSFTSGGMNATGVFALHARALFVTDVAMFDYVGEEEILGRRAVRYDYRIPQLSSGFLIQTAAAHGKSAVRGAFWADPQTLDVIRLDVEADEIPPYLEISSATHTIDYARTRIGDGDILLPQNAATDIRHDSGEAARNIIEFTHCRSFAAQSSISFDEPAAPAADARPKLAAATPALPPELTLSIELTTEIRETDPVGKLIEGRVAADVLHKKKVIVPAGAAVHGRIRRLERRSDFGSYFAVGLEFTDVVIAGAPVRFYAIFEEIDERGPVKLMMRRNVRPKRDEAWRDELMYLPYVAGVASFFVPGERLDIPKGLRTVWKTKEPR